MKTIFSFLFTFAAFSTFAQTTHLKGVIRETTCNQASGLGIIELEQTEKRVLKMTSLKVNSMDLCGSAPGAFSKLGSIGYDAVLTQKTNFYEVTLEHGYVTQIEDLGPVDYTKFIRRIKSVEKIGVKETGNWFYNGPAQILYGQTNIAELVEKYTVE